MKTMTPNLQSLPIVVLVVLACASAGCSGSGATAADAGAGAQGSSAAQAPPTPAERLRTELETWRSVPYLENGSSRQGIGNVGLVRAVFQAAFEREVPATYDELFRTGRLVTREALGPGDLVFFESSGFGPFRTRHVGLYLGDDDVAIANRDLAAVAVVKLSSAPWDRTFRTARRISSVAVEAPVFDLAQYGDNRAALLRDIAEAWTGVLYRAGGTTFEGIGNDEFVRQVYGAIYETDLEGDPLAWATMGVAVADQAALEPGDVILYEERSGLGGLVRQRHAALYIGDGDVVAALHGSAVSITKLADPGWQQAYRGARRIDPDILARVQEERDRVAAEAAAAKAAAAAAVGDRAAAARANRERVAVDPSLSLPTEALTTHEVTDLERRLRDVTAEWQGTPYQLGGTSRAGIDCSAFTRVVYDAIYDVDLPRTAQEQERLGAAVERSDLQPGDLIFFRTQGMGPLFRSRHVGVYLGGGEFAQASGRLGVTVSSLENRYWSGKYHAARRLPSS